MPFWCNDTMGISLIRQTSTVQRFISSFILIFFPTVFLFFFFYLPSASQIKKLNIDNKNLSQQKEKLDQIYSRLKIFESDNKKLLEQLNLKLKQDNPSEFMMDLIQKNNLSCSSIRPIKFKKNNLIKKDYFTVCVKGIFKDCLGLFDDLSKSDQIIKICDLKMCKWKENRVKFDLVFRYVSLED